MILVNLFGGVFLLLYGIKLLGEGLQHTAGSKIRSLLRSITSNRLAAVGGGALVTGLIQSGSATSVMLVGFVSAGLMSFRQTLAVILGADIGATLTVQLIAFHIYDYAALIIGVGLLFVLFTKRSALRHAGEGILGFGFVFLALKIMTDAAVPLEGNDLFRQVIVALTGSPFVGIALSAGITALIHSSAATMGIAIVLATTGLLSLDASLYIMLGANIGTCSTAFLAGLRASAEARRVAWAHIAFKLMGVLLVLPFFPAFERLVMLTSGDMGRRIANAHTLFNMFMAAAFLPFISPFAAMIAKFVPETGEERRFGPLYLDSHVLGTPPLALGQATREVLRESDIVREMLHDMVNAFQSDDLSLIDRLKEKDNLIDVLDRQIRLYITGLSSSPLTPSQSRRAMTVLEATRNLESIGDILDRNIMPLAAKRISKGITFSEKGMAEMISYHKRTIENFDMAVSAFAGSDRDLADRVLRNKEDLGIMERELVQAHLDRLRQGMRESIETSHIHLDLLGNVARINSLITHIVYPIIEEKRVRGRGDVGIER